MMKKVLTVAGSDCSGGAGIQADLKTFAAHGVYGMSVIVAVVAENTSRVLGMQEIAPEIIEQQLDAVFEDIGADAVKVGMLSGSACMEAVARKLRQYRTQNIVIDPVMEAKGGCALMQPESRQTFRKEILPLADLLTPNIPEAEEISGMAIRSPADMERAAERIAGMGARVVLVKGGHASGDALDILFDGARFYRFCSERIPTKNTHGTGCTYSSAIASNLALGLTTEEAVRRAKEYVTTAIRHSLSIGKGCGPTHHFYDLYRNGLQKGTKKA
jgi:hydroxymethylpyrimidine/phosphomethylpyrimidine kinase